MNRLPTPWPCRDQRYTVAPEQCGHSTPRFVARFCGMWIGQSETRTGAVAIVRAHVALERARRAFAQAEADLDLAIASGRAS